MLFLLILCAMWPTKAFFSGLGTCPSGIEFEGTRIFHFCETFWPVDKPGHWLVGLHDSTDTSHDSFRCCITSFVDSTCWLERTWKISTRLSSPRCFVSLFLCLMADVYGYRCMCVAVFVCGGIWVGVYVYVAICGCMCMPCVSVRLYAKCCVDGCRAAGL